MRKTLAAIATCISLYGNAQGTTSSHTSAIRDNGATAVKKVLVPIKTDYLSQEEYRNAEIRSADNKIMVAAVRLNLLDHKVLYQEDGVEMELVTPVKTVAFTKELGNDKDVVYEKGFPATGTQTPNNFYRVVVNGKAKLLLDTRFAEKEGFVMGSGMVSSIDKQLSYYGASRDKIVRIIKPEDLAVIMSDHEKEVSEYIKKENIKVKRSADLEKLFIYYNSLP